MSSSNGARRSSLSVIGGMEGRHDEKCQGVVSPDGLDGLRLRRGTTIAGKL
jgi:hypothetical protein